MGVGFPMLPGMPRRMRRTLRRARRAERAKRVRGAGWEAWSRTWSRFPWRWRAWRRRRWVRKTADDDIQGSDSTYRGQLTNPLGLARGEERDC